VYVGCLSGVINDDDSVTLRLRQIPVPAGGERVRCSPPRQPHLGHSGIGLRPLLERPPVNAYGTTLTTAVTACDKAFGRSFGGGAGDVRP